MSKVRSKVTFDLGTKDGIGDWWTAYLTYPPTYGEGGSMSAALDDLARSVDEIERGLEDSRLSAHLERERLFLAHGVRDHPRKPR